CDSSFSVGPSSCEEVSDISARENLAVSAAPCPSGMDPSKQRLLASRQMEQSPAWQGELSQRVEAYRTRRRRVAPNAAQSQFSFEDPSGKTPRHSSAAVEESPG